MASISIDETTGEVVGLETEVDETTGEVVGLETEVAEAEETKKEEIGFDLSKFRYDGPRNIDIPANDDCEVINGGKVPASELLKGNTQPILAITREVWNEVQYLVNLTPNLEMAMFLILKRFSSVVPKFLAVDLFLPEQEVSPGGVRIDGESVNRFYSDLNEHPDYREHMHGRLCHLHSHAKMGCSWSEVDKNQQFSRNDLGFFDDYRFYVVTNVRGELRCSFVQYKPFLRRFDNLPVVIIGRGAELTEERKAELMSWVFNRTRMFKKGDSVFENLESFPSDITEQYVPPQYEPKRGYDADEEDDDYYFDDADRCYKKQNSTATYGAEGLVKDFIYWCMENPDQGDVFSDREIDLMISEVGKHLGCGPLAEVLGKLDIDEKRCFFNGYAEFVPVQKEELVSILPWFLLNDYSFIRKNQWNLNRLLPFLQTTDC